MWADLIPSHAKRNQVLDLLKELRLPLEFRQMKPQDALLLEPELYIAELQKMEVTAKTQSLEGNIKNLPDSSNFKWLVDVKKDVKPINTLTEVFQKMLIEDFLEFKIKYPKYEETIWLSETTRTVEDQALILLKFWQNSKLASTYGKTGEKSFIYTFMQKARNTNFANKIQNLSGEELSVKYNLPLDKINLILPFAHNPIDQEALKIFRVFASSEHMSRKAVDISGSSNNPKLKKDLVYFLHRKRKYTIFLYKNNGQSPYITSKNGKFYFYGTETEISSDSFVFRAMEEHGNINGWFFHIQKI